MLFMCHRCSSAPGAPAKTTWGHFGATKNRTPIMDGFWPITSHHLNRFGCAIRRWKALVEARTGARFTILPEQPPGSYGGAGPMVMEHGADKVGGFHDPCAWWQVEHIIYHHCMQRHQLHQSAECAGDAHVPKPALGAFLSTSVGGGRCHPCPCGSKGVPRILKPFTRVGARCRATGSGPRGLTSNHFHHFHTALQVLCHPIGLSGRPQQPTLPITPLEQRRKPRHQSSSQLQTPGGPTLGLVSY